MSTEARELELVNKVELKIALSQDEKLQAVLTTYLPPLLLKLASEHQSVRNKVISTCQHIKVRLSGNESIILPVSALLKQYKDNAASSMVRHFDLLFIQQSIGKLSSSEQLNLLPTLLHGLSKDSSKSSCATVFNLFLRLLPRLRLPPRGSKEDDALRSTLGLDEHIEDAALAAKWFGKLILLTVIRNSQLGPNAKLSCPGVSEEEYSFLTVNGKAEAWDPTTAEGLNLVETKIKVLQFMGSGAFTDEERFDAALFASADPNSRISDLGEDMMKRSGVSLENRSLVDGLYMTYSGARPALQTRILSLLSKSVAATQSPRAIVAVVERGITPTHASIPEVKGLEAKKLRNAIFNFMNWISRMGAESDLRQIGPAVVVFLRNFIESQGWPIPNDRSPDEAAMRALAYETLGSMAKAVPSVVKEPDLDLVKWLFRSLTEEKSSDTITISVQGALASILNAFDPPLDTQLTASLRSLLLKYIMQVEGDDIVRSARFATVRWANRCLEYSDVAGRWIDIMAIGARADERSDVVEEGLKGLDPYWYQLGSTSGTASLMLPDWNELVNVFFTARTMLDDSHEANTVRSAMEVDGVSVLGNFGGSKIAAFAHAVNYCRRMLLFGALKSQDASDADWERQLDVLLRTDLPSRELVKTHMKSLSQAALSTWLSAAFEGLVQNEGNGLGDCGKIFVEFGALSTKEIIGTLARRFLELLPVIQSNNSATRLAGAKAFGFLAPHPVNPSSTITDAATSLMSTMRTWSSAVGSEVNKIHGATSTVGFLLSRAVYYGRGKELDEGMLQQAIDYGTIMLKDAKDATIREGALVMLNQLAGADLLTQARLMTSTQDMSSVINMLTGEAKKGNETAISALGRISMAVVAEGIDSEVGSLSDILRNLYALYELRQSEIHFCIGEALACVAGRWESDALILSMDVETSYHGGLRRHDVVESMLQKLLDDCKTTKPSLKKASGIWLFCLVQHCGRFDEVQARLRECQAAFMGLLSARDDLVQETASRGLSLVYEQGDKDLKERLVNDLVASFTGTTTKIKVDDETELFEPGALPTTDGESITSYKDIMSLAAEVGDQSLVYRFMSLASNAATWSTRAAFGRFGLSSILSESVVDPKIYPKLYRYRFDPNKNVQRSMIDIWTALVKNPTVVINDHFDSIMDDLLKNILGKEWRTRQASCAAIADLVQGRQFDKYEKYLSQIWDVAFKVLDDIKGSVRESAASLCKVLTTILVRQLEQGTSSKNAHAMLEQVIPFLFSTRGLESASDDVKAFAYDTVLKLVKNGGKSLLPFIPTIAEQILGLLSTLEPDFVNYLVLNAEKYGHTAEDIDAARSQAVSHSPLMESVERCLDLIDDDTMAKLVPRLENVMKTAVGVPSKIACSGVLISLATRHSFQFRAHADVFLKDIERAVLDRNKTVSASYARSAGYIARLATDAAILRLVKFAKKLYLEAEDETRRQITAELIYAISKYATDRFNSLASDFLPFVFLAKHDFDDHVKEQFGKTWDENVGGSRAVRLYLKEILSICSVNLESPRWAIKHTSAITVADVVTSCGDEIPTADAETIWPVLVKALILKTFEGKENLLEGFVKFVTSSHAFWKDNDAFKAQTKKVAIREAKRNNDAYRPHAFVCLGKYAEQRDDIDMFDEVFDIVAPRLEEFADDDKMDTTDDDKKAGSHEAATITAGINALFRAINLKIGSSEAPLKKLLGLLKPVLASNKVTVATKMAFYERSKVVFKGLSGGTHSSNGNGFATGLAYFALLQVSTGAGAESVRLARAEAAEFIVKAHTSGVFGSWQDGKAEAKDIMQKELGEARSHERSPQVQTVLDRTMETLRIA